MAHKNCWGKSLGAQKKVSINNEYAVMMMMMIEKVNVCLSKV